MYTFFTYTHPFDSHPFYHRRADYEPIIIGDCLKRIYHKWVTEGDNQKKGGGKHFARTAVRQARADKTATFPRDVHSQHKVDQEHERYMRTQHIHDPGGVRLFSHYVKHTATSRRERMRVYDTLHDQAAVQKTVITAHMIGERGKYVVTANRRAGVQADDVVICQMPGGHVFGQYHTGVASTFTIRDVKYRGKLVVQLVPHKGIRESERRTWRLHQAASNIGKLVWVNGDDEVVWRAAPFNEARSIRQDTCRKRVETAIAANAEPQNKRPRLRRALRTRGCLCGKKDCIRLGVNFSLHRQNIPHILHVDDAPCQPKDSNGTTATVRFRRANDRQRTRWLNHEHAKAFQRALGVVHYKGSKRKGYNLVHWHPQFIVDSLTKGWKPGRALPKTVSVQDASRYGMAVSYGDPSIVGIQRVVNRPSTSYTVDGEPRVLAIPNCTPDIWINWLRVNGPSSLRFDDTAPPPSPSSSIPLTSATSTSSDTPPSSVTSPSSTTPPSSAASRVYVPSPSSTSIADVLTAAQTCDISPADRAALMRSIRGIRDHPESSEVSPQDLHVSRQQEPLVGVSRASLCSAKWMDAPGKHRVYTYYGYRDMTFNQMLCLITQVHFPDLGPLQFSMGPTLSPVEQCLLAKQWLWKCGGKVSNHKISDQWGIQRRMVSKYIQKWAPLWGEVGNRYSRLMVDEEFFMASQPKGFSKRYVRAHACDTLTHITYLLTYYLLTHTRYARPISHMTDGSVIQVDVPRTSSLRSQLLYADKIKHQGVLGIDLTTPIGLCFLSMPLYGGKCSEKRYMQVHRDWLDVIPAGFGRLVDKGFANTGLFYKNRSRAYVPAFVRAVVGCLTAHESRYSYEQSSDRYTCETYFSRVKKAFGLNGQVSYKKMRYLQNAWSVSHYNANLMRPLRS